MMGDSAHSSFMVRLEILSYTAVVVVFAIGVGVIFICVNNLVAFSCTIRILSKTSIFGIQSKI